MDQPGTDQIPPSQMPSATRRLGWLDALRGWAALIVAGFHLSPSVLLPERHMAILRHIDLGKYGVLLFFLVSGYVIPMSLERHGSLRRFWTGRLFRIYPAYLVAIGAAAALGFWHGGLLAHASMLVDLVGVRGAVRVFWTLSYEMVFYLIAAGLYAWGLHRRSALWATVTALVALLAGPALPNGLLHGRWWPAVLLALAATSIGLAFRHPRAGGLIGLAFVLLPAVNAHATAKSTAAGSWEGLLLLAVMFAGTVVYRCQHGQITYTVTASSLCVIAAALVLAHPGHLVWLATTAATAVTFAVAFAARHRPMPRVLTFVGRISYSLYLLHVLVLNVILRLTPGLVHRPAGERFTAGVAFLALALAAAWTSYTLVEAPAQRLGRRMGGGSATLRAAPRIARGENRSVTV
jgi:peptidoglycan/LPS O-acetylase OafA/YrhL